MMHGHEKSDSAIVATKPPNNAGRPAAEAVGRRAEAEENANRCCTRRTQGRERVSPAQERVRTARGQPSIIRGGSRMQESCTYDSVREPSNGRPYPQSNRALDILIVDRELFADRNSAVIIPPAYWLELDGRRQISPDWQLLQCSLYSAFVLESW
jgi:hypothetical protein